jgi:hypothetical protein
MKIINKFNVKLTNPLVRYTHLLTVGGKTTKDMIDNKELINSIAEIIEKWRKDNSMTSHRIAGHIIELINSIDELQEKEICLEYDRMNPCWSFAESGISGCTDCTAYRQIVK